MSQRDLNFEGATPPRKPPRRTALTVSQVLRGSSRALEQHFGQLVVEGEVVGFKVAASGHAFFSVVEGTAVLPVAMWRSALDRHRYRPRDGEQIRLLGRLGIYERQGRFQMYAERMAPVGEGAAAARLEELRRKLHQEGLFAPDRKRELPSWPRRVGVVTSAGGAAIHDVIEVARRRCPVPILLSPAVVQGPGAPAAIVRALRRLEAFTDVDVIIVGRGGGASEDLAAFNDERVVRAVVAAPVPVVAAIGHEVDVSLTDLAADARAATPSHAAELVVPDREPRVARLRVALERSARSLRRTLIDVRARQHEAFEDLGTGVVQAAQTRRSRLASLRLRLDRAHPKAALAEDRHRLERLQNRMDAALRRTTSIRRDALARLSSRTIRAGAPLPQRARNRLASAAAKLDALSPLGVLARGYALVTDVEGRALRSAESVEPGDTVEVRLASGSLTASVERKTDR